MKLEKTEKYLEGNKEQRVGNNTRNFGGNWTTRERRFQTCNSLTQFRKVRIAGEKEGYLAYDLAKGEKRA